MKSAITLVLMGCLAVSEGSVGPAGDDGPIARAIASEGRRLAAEDSVAGDLGAWHRVTEIAPATELAITFVGDQQPLHRVFVSADDSRLVALNLTDPSLPKSVVHALRALADDHAKALVRLLDNEIRIDAGDVLVSPDGVFVGARERRRVADVSDVLQRIPRAEVAEILITRERGGAIGGVAGFALGCLAAPFAAYLVSGDYPSAFSKALSFVTLVGAPIGAGYLGYRAAVHTETTVVYRATPGL